jgi:Putative DNA-binding domain
MRQTSPMDLDEVRRVLADGRLEAMVGVRECGWLDAKREPYKLGQPKQDAELLKDAVALANARGGVLVIGLETTKQDRREVITGLRPIEKMTVNVEQIRMLIRARSYPHIRDLAIEWIPADDVRGFLVIDVPAQPETEKPFVVKGRSEADGVRVPIRDDDGTHWLSGEKIQRLLSSGWNAISAERAMGNISKELFRDRMQRQYEELRPKLEGRFVPYEGDEPRRSCRVEVKIISSEPLTNIVVEMPYGDKRLAVGGHCLQTRSFGPNTVLRPGRWLPFEGLVRLASEPPIGKLQATANCRDGGTRWDYVMLEIEFVGVYEASSPAPM